MVKIILFFKIILLIFFFNDSECIKNKVYIIIFYFFSLPIFTLVSIWKCGCFFFKIIFYIFKYFNVLILKLYIYIYIYI